MPAAARPATMLELEQRVDVALAVARSAEAAAIEIGAAALDAAKQARRAAEFAERAVSGEDAPRPLPVEDDGPSVDPVVEDAVGPRRNGSADQDERLRLFKERADRVLTRLLEIERLPQRTG